MRIEGACLLLQNPTPSGSPQIMINGGRKTTIIFNPRVCSDVDLEVGNLICIHPPWYGTMDSTI